MEPLIIEETETTPKVNFTPEENRFEITGRSIMDNPEAFYQPIITWISKNVAQISNALLLKVKFEAFNPASSKMMLELFNQLSANPDARVHWIFSDEDEDIEEIGQELADLAKIRVELKPA